MGLFVGACSFDTSGIGGDAEVGARDGGVDIDGSSSGEECTDSDDCVDGVCELGAGVCVECLGDEHCPGYCDREANLCIECRRDRDCGAGEVCGEGNRCVEDAPRPAVCDGEPVDLNQDAAHCGACGNVCGDGTSGVCRGGHCESAAVCDDTATSDFGAGDGSPADPYLICSAAQLGRLSGTDDDDLLESHFLLAADIDLDGVSFSPIGPEKEFTGRFDGNHYRLSKMTLEVTSTRSGFFAHLGSEGHVLNVVFEEVEGEGDEDEVGLLAGFNEGLIENAVAFGVVRGAEQVGGLVGRHEGELRASRAEVQTSGDDVIGGLIGLCVDGTVIEASALGDVAGRREVGGLVGRAEGSCGISDARAAGAVKASEATVGGLVGMLRDGAAVRRSAATGPVELAGDGAEAGGLIGIVHSSGTSVSESFATGAVTAADAADVGGLIGHVRREAVIRDSYATGNVGGNGEVGGLIGRVERSDTTIERTYAIGLVTGDSVGGLVGDNASNDNVEASYWWFDPDENDQQPDESAGGESLTTAEFGEAERFDGWDFGDIWTIEDGQGAPVGRRPILRWQLEP
jgi:hypothetical protein